MQRNIMSTVITAVQYFSLAVVTVGFLTLFKPLLVGCARAAVLVVKPKLSKEERLQRRQVRALASRA